MEQRFTPIADLPELSLLLHARLSSVKSMILNPPFQSLIKINDFESLFQRLEEELIFTPVNFAEPSCVLSGYNIVRQSVAITPKKVSVNYLHVLKYAISGSEILFSYSPDSDYNQNHNGLIFFPQDHYLIFPIELTGINCWYAQQQAEGFLQATFDMINENNNKIRQWNPILRQKIEDEINLVRHKHSPLRKIS